MSAARTLLEEAIAEAGGPEAFADLVGRLSPEQRQRLAFDWRLRARPSQLPPAGQWRTWLVLAGRGFGKSRTGAEAVRAEVEAGRAGRVALVGPTAADARDVMVERGLLAIAPPWARPRFEPSKRRLTWPNGASATLFSADEPDRLRGPQHDYAWADEVAAWPSPTEAWNQLQLGLRIGARPRAVATTTPRPIKLVLELLKDPSTAVTRGTTFENAANLAAPFLEEIRRRHEGTRFGRQELYGEVLADNPDALWRLDDIDAARVRVAPELRRIAVGVDPAISTTADSDETGIVAAGVAPCSCRGTLETHAFVLEDASGVMTPATWARAVRAVYGRHRADRVVVEVNQGGDLVESNLRGQGGEYLSLQKVHATRGKALRAEPVAALYEQGMVHHVGGNLSQLETQMINWSPLEASKSPDRVDALVYVLTELMLNGGGEFQWPTIRGPILSRRC